MKALRIIAISLGVLLVCLLTLATAFFLSPGLQTWVVTKALGSSENTRVQIEEVDLDWNGLTARGVNLIIEGEQSGQIGASIASLDVQVRFMPLLKREVRVSRLHASGIVADLSQLPLLPAEQESDESEPFKGIFDPLRESGLKLWVDDVSIQGTIVLPEERSGLFEISGGGILPGETGTLVSSISLRLPPDVSGGVSEVISTQEIAVTQDEHGLSAIEVTTHARATGPDLEYPAVVNVVARAWRSGDGEQYQVRITAADEQPPLAEVDAAFSPSTGSLSFTYEVDVDDATIAALGLYGLLPSVSLTGQGEGNINLQTLSGTAQGNLEGRFIPGVVEGATPLPPVSMAAAFNVQSNGEQVAISSLNVQGSLSDQSILQLSIPQPLTVSLEDPLGSLPAAAVLVELVLDVPLHVLVPEQLQSGQLQGQFQVLTRNGILVLESLQPLLVRNLVVSQEGQAPIGPIELTVSPVVSVESERVSLRLNRLGGQVGQQVFLDGEISAVLSMPGAGDSTAQSLTSEGELRIDLDALYDSIMPAAAAGNQGRMSVQMRADAKDLSAGVLEADIVLGLTGVDADGDVPPVEELSIEVNISRDSVGLIHLSAPLTIRGTSGRTVLSLEASADTGQAAGAPVRFKAELQGKTVYADDLQALAVAFSAPTDEGETAVEAPPPSQEPDAAPPWAGVEGVARVNITRVLLGGNELKDIRAELRVSPQAIQLSDFQASFADQPASAAFSLAFTDTESRPYVLNAAFEAKDFDIGSVDRQVRGGSQMLIEGLFNISGAFSGQGPNLQTLPEWLEGSIAMRAEEAVYRPLANMQLAGGVLSAISTYAPGFLLGEGKKNTAVVVQELTSLLQGVQSERLQVDITLQEGFNVSIDHFELISPQLSFVGNGGIDYDPAVSLLKQPINLNIQMGARGNAAHALNSMRLLKGQQNEMGYYVGPSFQNSGSLLSPGSTLANLIRSSLTNVTQGPGIELPDMEVNTVPPPPDDQQNQNPLNALRDLLGDRKPESGQSEQEAPADDRPTEQQRREAAADALRDLFRPRQQ